MQFRDIYFVIFILAKINGTLKFHVLQVKKVKEKKDKRKKVDPDGTRTCRFPIIKQTC